MSTIGEVLAERAARVGDRPFLLWEGRTTTYAEVDRITNSYARGLADLGIGHGTVVAVMMANCAEFLWTVWGLGKLGAVAVPMNTAARGDQLSYYLRQSGATLGLRRRRVVAGAGRAARRGHGGARRAGARGDADRPAGGDVPAVGGRRPARRPARARPARRPYRPDADHVHVRDDRSVEGRGVPAVAGPRRRRPDGAALRLHPGRRALHVPAAVPRQRALVHRLRRAVGGRVGGAVPAVLGALVLAEIRESGATEFNALGAMANIIWQLPPVRRRPRPPGAHGDGRADHPGSSSRVRRALRHHRDLGVRHDGELRGHRARPGRPARTRRASAGRVRDDVGVQIIDDDGSAAADRRGRRDLRAAEPARDDDARLPRDAGGDASARSADLWFRTGDRGYLDEDGYLFFVDRKKEAIRRRGENISAYELETDPVPAPRRARGRGRRRCRPTCPRTTSWSTSSARTGATRRTRSWSASRRTPWRTSWCRATGSSWTSCRRPPSQKIEKYKLKTDAVERRERAVGPREGRDPGASMSG